jgi:putative ABC transport system permease protein
MQRWLDRMRLRLRSLFRRAAVDHDLRRELDAHVQASIEEHVAAGRTPADARRLALRAFGNVAGIEEACRDTRGVRLLDDLARDVSYGVRALRREPAFALVAVLTLALGIGANTAIFSVVDAVMLRPLPFQDPDRLAILWETRPTRDQVSVSAGEFLAWQQQSHAFVDMSALDWEVLNVTGGDAPVQTPVGFVSTNFFDLLGARAAVGRLLQPQDADKQHEPAAVVSYAFWQQHFGGDQAVIGQAVQLNGVPYTIVGVLPPTFLFWNFDDVGVWAPVDFPTDVRELNDHHHLNVVGRLAPGETLASAQRDLAGVMADLAHRYPDSYANYSATLATLRDEYFGDVRTPILILMGAVGFVLLIACANVANLLLAHAAGRRQELAVRLALGASRSRLVRQFLAESLVLSTAGGAMGVLVALWGEHALSWIVQRVLPSVSTVTLNASVFLFMAVVSVATGLMFGIGPAMHASRARALHVVTHAVRNGRGTSHARGRSVVVVIEVALSVVLLVGAGLLLRSFARLLHVDPGFNPAHVFAAQITLPEPGGRLTRLTHADSNDAVRARQWMFFRTLLENVQRDPDVVAAAAVSDLPLSGNSASTGFSIDGRPEPPADQRTSAQYAVITPDYFRAMGIPTLKGRAFADRDSRHSEPVVMVNATMARQYWPDDNPIGAHIRVGGVALTIVGVAGDVRSGGVSRPAAETFYRPAAQTPVNDMTLVVRTAGNRAALARVLRTEVARLDRDVPIGDVATMDDLVAHSSARWRMNAILMGVFAAMALLLAAIGVYGVMSYIVAQRTHDIGIRVALGASSRDVLRPIIGASLRVVAAGVGLGLLAASLLTQTLSSVLFDVSPLDAATFAAIPIVLGLVALVASYVPARRALKVDALVALRND